MEQFELISPAASEITIHGQKVPINHDKNQYASLKIPTRDFDNPKQLLGYGDIVRFFSDTNPSLVSATEEEIRQHIPQDIPKILSLDKFHFESIYKNNKPPSHQETYQLIAKVLVSRDATQWRPTLEPNNHWSNWESGNL